MSPIYRVVLGPLARNDLEEAYQYAAGHEPIAAARWYHRFITALQTLSERPDRCPLSAENGKSPVELRDFLFGKRPYVFRVIYTIQTDVVLIIRIRRAQRRRLGSDEIRDSLDQG
ncbi:MAG: type II toxin-antitoxin system RelE/ParE family toxin [Schlesneria sp.]